MRVRTEVQADVGPGDDELVERLDAADVAEEAHAAGTGVDVHGEAAVDRAAEHDRAAGGCAAVSRVERESARQRQGIGEGDRLSGSCQSSLPSDVPAALLQKGAAEVH